VTYTSHSRKNELTVYVTCSSDSSVTVSQSWQSRTGHLPWGAMIRPTLSMPFRLEARAFICHSTAASAAVGYIYTQQWAKTFINDAPPLCCFVSASREQVLALTDIRSSRAKHQHQQQAWPPARPPAHPTDRPTSIYATCQAPAAGTTMVRISLLCSHAMLFKCWPLLIKITHEWIVLK